MSLISDALKRVEEQRAVQVRARSFHGMAAPGKRFLTRRTGMTIGAILATAALVAIVSLYHDRPQPRSGLRLNNDAAARSQSSPAQTMRPAIAEQAIQPTGSQSSPAQTMRPASAVEDQSSVKKLSAKESAEVPVKAPGPVKENNKKVTSAQSRGSPAALTASTRAKPSVVAVEKSLSAEAKGQTGYLELRTEMSDNPAAVYREAVALQKQGRWREAEKVYQRLLDRLPMTAEVHNNLGVIYEKQGDLKKAIEYYEKAVEIDPRFFPGFNNLGVIFYRLKSYERARVALERALALNGENTQSLVNLGLVYGRLGRQVQARRVLEQAIGREPGNLEAHYNLARLLDDQGDYEVALKHYGRFLALKPSAYPRLWEMVRKRVKHLRETLDQ